MGSGWLLDQAGADVCFVTTRGRRTGRDHRIEIWFAVSGRSLYILSGLACDWVRNVLAHPAVQVRLGDESRPGLARVVDDPAEDARARRLLAAKYLGWRDGSPLGEWAATAVPVAIDVEDA